MSITLSVYSNVTGKTNSVTFDVMADFLADTVGGDPNVIKYFVKASTGARDTDGLTYSPRYMTSLTSLALNNTKQSASNTAAAYTNVKAMVEDYMYDYIYGHTANKYSSGCTAKAAMRFT